ncbi:NAD(P)H-dependent oxidoreductase [Thiofilum flexile]|uniref:NAD(P)H-dependent oxidoreductase n=1 Tax=Thiofilum flexile TaxID=125627 RepID=UPI0003704DE7|nr:NAD(P)H-dependent oxidoreductase [Thiofilum flexile]
MQRILVLLAHPAFEHSRSQSYLADAVRSLEGVKVHDLYHHYPDFMVDVMREQGLLMEHDVIVFQHPFYWYSIPALLKEWMDLVLEHGLGYGSTAVTLKGKYLMNALSAGGSRSSYQAGGLNRFTIKQLLAPFEQTANLCGMHYLEPFVVYEADSLSEKQLAQYAEQYRNSLLALQRGDTWS